MSDMLSIITLVVTGVATAVNVVSVVKRYKELKQDEIARKVKIIKKLNAANQELKEASDIWVELKTEEKPIFDTNKQKEFEKLIIELELLVKEAEKNKTTSKGV